MDIKPPKTWRGQHGPSPKPIADDKIQPKQPVANNLTAKPQPEARVSQPQPQPVVEEETAPLVVLDTPEIDVKKDKPAKIRRKIPQFVKIILSILLLIGTVVGVAFWFISPLNSDSTQRSFVVKEGESPSLIGTNLEKQKFIKSQLAFSVFVRLTGDNTKLKAGTYKISSNESIPQIVAHLLKGNDEVYNLTIPPGLTLKQLADPAVKNSFAAQGFSESDIQKAYTATYQSPLFVGRPSGSTLEGYIFPETFQVRATDSLETVLQRSFDELYSRMQKDGLSEKLAQKNLSIYQAITLASIVQEETSSPQVQPQVAQVFLKRLETGMPLGSDVTFIYAARQLGVAATPDFDSPYNTRIHAGFPPGPIANFNYSALQAVAEPAAGDYLYFVAGDDGQVYFSRTNEEHESLVAKYCQKLCNEPL